MKTYDTIRFCHTDKDGSKEIIATCRLATIDAGINFLEGYMAGLDAAGYSTRLRRPMVMACDGYQFWREDGDHKQIERWWLEDGDGNAL